MPKEGLVERIMRDVDTSGECWEWTGHTDTGGYGSVTHQRRSYSVHRVMAAAHFGMFDRRLFVLHSCDNRRCVRPEHLHLGDAKRNAEEASERNRYHNQNKDSCVNGHPFDEENTYLTPNGRRNCRACRAESVRRYVAKKKGSESLA